jgi:hypothetical protein
MTKNTATGGGLTDFGETANGQGGALYNSGSIKLIGSTISNNTALGGGFYSYFPYVSPAADGQGGGMYNSGAAQISASVISDNMAAGGSSENSISTTYGNGWGGAIFDVGLIQVFNTMLSNNFTFGANNYGEAIYNTGAFSADPNSIVWPNSSGTPPLAYDWQINGTNITNATIAPFNLTNVQFNVSAIYSLLISNNAGLVTNFDEILNQPVAVAPAIVLQPSSQVVPLGTTASMEVDATGFPAPNFQWLLNGSNIPGAINNILVLTNAQQYESGTYTVKATNLNGSSTSQPAVLTIEPLLLTAINLGNAGFSISSVGIGGTYVIETSTNLSTWQSLQTNISPFTFVDTNPVSGPSRFYRSVLVH